MKKIGLILFIAFLPLFSMASFQKIAITYNLEDIHVIHGAKYLGENKKKLRLDFDMGGRLVFYKQGYISQIVEIDNKKPFSTLVVALKKNPDSGKSVKDKLLQMNKLVMQEFITNVDTTDLKEIISTALLENNYNTGKPTASSPNAAKQIENAKYKLNIELVDSEQIRSVYQYPRFMMASTKFRWTIEDKKTGDILYFKETEGVHFIQVVTHIGLEVSKRMTEITEEAIKDSLQQVLNDKDFKKIFNS